MNVERLKRLAALLRADAANPEGVKFDLGEWATSSGDADLKYGEELPMNCGTTACAMGLAVISGEFADDGLEAKYYPWGNGFIIVPQFEGEEQFDAAARLFDISTEDSYGLFDPGHYSGVRTGAEGELSVANRIDTLIEKGSFEVDDD